MASGQVSGNVGDPRRLERVPAIDHQLAVAIRRQAIEDAALRERLVAVQIQDVLGDIAVDVLLVRLVGVQIVLDQRQMPAGDELREERVVVVDDVVLVGLRGHGQLIFGNISPIGVAWISI